MRGAILCSVLVLVCLEVRATDVEFIVKQKVNRDGVHAESLKKVTPSLQFPKSGLHATSVDLEYRVIQVPEDQADSTLMELYGNPDVVSVDPNYPVEISQTPDVLNDPMIQDQSHLYQTQVLNAMEIVPTRHVTVAIVDTGVDINHPDLRGRIAVNMAEAFDSTDNDNNGFIDDRNGYNFYRYSQGGGGNDVRDVHGHGTHLAGIVAASANNRRFGSGINPSARILPVPFMDSTGRGTQFDAAAAIKYAVDMGAEVINCSWGFYIYSGVLQDAVDYAYDHGVFVIGAAGNDGGSTAVFPASFDHAISVGSCDALGHRSSFSNRNSAVDFLAFGEGISSTLPNNGFGRMTGTSQATAVVSAIVSRVLSGVPTHSISFEHCINSVQIQTSEPAVIDPLRWIKSFTISTQSVMMAMAAESNPDEVQAQSLPTVRLSEALSFPNPVRTGVVNVGFVSATPGEVTIKLFDLNGRPVKTLTAMVSAGQNAVMWDLIGNNGQLVANGTYLYVIELIGDGGKARARGKLTVLR